MKSGVDTSSFLAVQRALQNKGEAVSRAARRAWFDSCLLAFADSVKRAPLDEGDLRESGYMTSAGRVVARGEIEGAKAFVKGLATDVSIGFTADHAIAQHEDTTLNHPEGEAKFLENAVTKLGAAAQQTLQQATERALRE